MPDPNNLPNQPHVTTTYKGKSAEEWYFKFRDTEIERDYYKGVAQEIATFLDTVSQSLINVSNKFNESILMLNKK